MDKKCPFFTPTLLTNYDNNNTKLFARNFPTDKYKIDVDFRPGYSMCNNNYCNSQPISHSRKERACLFPGKGNGSEYRQLVDLESELKRISNNDLREPLVLQQCCDQMEYKNTMPLNYNKIRVGKPTNLCMRGQNICTKYDSVYEPKLETPNVPLEEEIYFDQTRPQEMTIYNRSVNKSLTEVTNNNICQHRNLVIGQEQDLHNREDAWNNYTSRKINENF
tara:strand:+ start:5818 stop:6480 length:663 start_codon:yes stop_codon:yes gene_type:complete